MGATVSLAHLSPYVRISKDKIRKKIIGELKGIDVSEERIEEIVNSRLKEEVRDGIQTFNYQLNTLQTSSGQSPFVSVMMYIDEVEGYQEETAMLIEEVLKQRLQGIKNEVGVYTTYEFPKLLYVLDNNNMFEKSKYYYLTYLSAECTAKRLVPKKIGR